MKHHWEDVNARARGLGGRLLEPEALASLAQVDGLGSLGRALAARGLVPEDAAGRGAPELALALRRAAGRELEILRRWLGPRDAALAVALDAEDRRSLRALIRGAADAAPAEVRLAGLIPTPSLPERVLRELAEQASVGTMGLLLLAAGHPCGSAILHTVGGGDPDLFRIELAIARALAERALRGSRGSGRFLSDYVADAVDRDNLRTALVLAASSAEEPAAALYLPGGRLRLDEFERAVRTGDVESAARVLGETAAGLGVASLLLRHATSPTALEAALETRTLAGLRRESRLDPLGPAPVLLFLHRLRRQSVALGRLVWGVDLGAPPSVRLTASPELA